MKRTILLVIILAWILLPTMSPDDFIAYYLMRVLGIELYLLLVFGLLAIMWYYKINSKKIGQGIKEVTKDVKRWFK